jgi:hypothetical protein
MHGMQIKGKEVLGTMDRTAPGSSSGAVPCFPIRWWISLDQKRTRAQKIRGKQGRDVDGYSCAQPCRPYMLNSSTHTPQTVSSCPSGDLFVSKKLPREFNLTEGISVAASKQIEQWNLKGIKK